MLRKYFYLGVLLAACGTVTSVSGQVTGKPIIVQKQAKVPTAQEATKIFSRERVRLVPLNQADKLQLINEALKDKGLAKVTSLTPPVEMTPTKPKQSYDNYLMYFKPWNAMVIDESVQFSPAGNWSESSLGIGYKPSAPGKYLIDLSVKKIGEISFTLITVDGKNNQTIKYPVSPDLYSHVTFLVDFVDTNAKGVLIYADKDWSFYGCEISALK